MKHDKSIEIKLAETSYGRRVLWFLEALYLNYLLSNQEGLFFFQCSCDGNQLNILSTFYLELLSWWSELRESADPDRGYKYILWNNKEILIEGRTVFL